MIVLKLTRAVTFNQIRFYGPHAVLPPTHVVLETESRLEPGTWLLEKGTAAAKRQYSEPDEFDLTVHVYRLAGGDLVALTRELLPEEAQPVDDPQIIAAMTGYRTLEEAIWQEWGIKIEYPDYIPAFKWIKCPICRQQDFTSLGFARVWCNCCNASFELHQLGGDSGFRVECRWDYIHYHPAKYLLPPGTTYCLSLLWKTDFGGPEDNPPEAEEWVLKGFAPSQNEYNRWGSSRHYTIDGEIWPGSGYLNVSAGSSAGNRRFLHALAREYQESTGEFLPNSGVATLFDHWASWPYGRVDIGVGWPRRGLPPVSELNGDQKYLLKKWLLVEPPSGGREFAWPVWQVVKPILGQPMVKGAASPIEGWQVVRQDNCPHCGQRVSLQDMRNHLKAEQAGVALDSEENWTLPHSHCRFVWQAGWEPYQAAAKVSPNNQDPGIEVSIRPVGDLEE